MTETGDDGDGTSILQKLAAQSGTEINDIDPETGAIQRRRPKGSSLKEAKTAQNLEGNKKVFHSKANCPLASRYMPPKPPPHHTTIRGPSPSPAYNMDLFKVVHLPLHTPQPPPPHGPVSTCSLWTPRHGWLNNWKLRMRAVANSLHLLTIGTLVVNGGKW